MQSDCFVRCLFRGQRRNGGTRIYGGARRADARARFFLLQ
jgi:hypothetical protein